MKYNNIIEVDINDKTEVFNKFNSSQISEELGNYISKQSKMIPLNQEMIIYIKDNGILNKDEKNHLVDAIREYYGFLVKEKLIYNKFNNVKKIILFIIGILLILLSDVFNGLFPFLIPELFLIAGWVAIWETVDNILFVDNKNRINIKKAKELSRCEIKFSDSK